MSMWVKQWVFFANSWRIKVALLAELLWRARERSSGSGHVSMLTCLNVIEKFCFKEIRRFWRRRKVGELGKITRTSWWMPKLIRRLRWIYPYSKLVDGKFCNSVTKSCWKNFLRKQQLYHWLLGFSAEIHPSGRTMWKNLRYCLKVFVRWCNVTGDGTLQPVTTCMNIQEDIHRGENLRGWNSWTFRWDIQRCEGLYCLIHFGELLWKICTGSLGEKLDESWYAYHVVGHEPSERHVAEYVQSNIDGDDSEENSWTIYNGWLDGSSWRSQVQYQKPCLIGIRSWKSEEDSGNDIPEDIHGRSGVDREPGSVQMGTGHAEEITEEIQEAGISAIAFDCGTGRDWPSTLRRCLWDCSNARHSRHAQRNLRVLHRRFAQMSVSWSFEVKDYDISRAYFQGTKEKLIHIWPERVEHNAELRKTTVALCREKHNATLLYNPNQDLRLAM